MKTLVPRFWFMQLPICFGEVVLDPRFVTATVQEKQLRKCNILGNQTIVHIVRADQNRASDELAHQFHDISHLGESLAGKRWQEERSFGHRVRPEDNLTSPRKH